MASNQSERRPPPPGFFFITDPSSGTEKEIRLTWWDKIVRFFYSETEFQAYILDKEQRKEKKRLKREKEARERTNQ